MKLLFWSSFWLIFYTYIGYPLLAYVLSRCYPQRLRGKYTYPKVSILMAVYNEEKRLEAKLKSLQTLDYPEERLEILIGSDGSTDRTDEIISRYMSRRIKFVRQPQRRGKPSVLNLLVPQASGEILVFTDARQQLDKNVLNELVKHFADDKVGSVSAALFYLDETTGSKTNQGIGLYWKYEKFIRTCESRTGSMLGATGALYAIRRQLFSALPEDLILDDVYVPMKVVEQGYRAIFDPKAKLFDTVFKNPREEFIRRARTLAGNYQLFFYLRGLFNPLKGKIAWQFCSHKVLRLLVPFLLITLYVSSAFLAAHHIKGYGAFFILQSLFYVLALAGKVSRRANPILDVPYMFCMMNAAAVVGLYRLIRRTQGILWDKA